MSTDGAGVLALRAGRSLTASVTDSVTPRTLSVHRMSPISARGLPFSTSTSHLRLVPSFLSEIDLIEAELQTLFANQGAQVRHVSNKHCWPPLGSGCGSNRAVTCVNVPDR